MSNADPTTITGKWLKALFYRAMLSVSGLDSLESHNAPGWERMCDYIESPWGDRKGIYLVGKVGSGKSTAMKAFSRLLRIKIDSEESIHSPVKYIKSSSLNDEFDRGSGDAQYVEWASRYKHIIIDDVGAEDPFDSYNKRYHFGPLVLAIYDMENRPTIHLTTNIKPPAVIAMYGERVMDRLAEITTKIEFITPKSYRL